MENAVALTMLQIDNIMEDDVTIPDEDEKTQKIYTQFFSQIYKAAQADQAAKKRIVQE